MDKELELSSTAQMEMATAAQNISQPPRRKGGLVTMPFIIANEALAKVASLGLVPNMTLYLMGNYKLHVGKATQIQLLSSATSNLTPVVGAFIADSYLGRFLTVGIGSIISLLGMTLLWLTAMIPETRPPASAKSAMPWQLAILISSLALMSIGNGGLQCSIAFGADQVNRKDNPNNQRVLEIFFSWYYAASAIAVIIALTGIVYIQDHLGWKVGFGVPAVLMLLSAISFFLASPLYIKNKIERSLLTGLAQVIVVAFKNRKLPLPPKNSSGLYHHRKGSDLLFPTDKLRFLNKACIIRDPEQDISPDGSASNPWNLSTVDQVEELKTLIRVIPLWSTGIMMSVNIGGSFGLLQARSMNRHIGNFEVPAGSFSVIMIITIFLWIAIYDRVILPVASKIRGKPVRISAKTRMGLGLFFSFLHLVTSAIVESVRRRRAIREGYLNNTHAVLNMSAVLWLAPQLCLGGIAEAFNAVGQNEFFYTEFPRTMSSVAASLSTLAMAAGNLISTLVFNIVQSVTTSGGKEGWVTDNINRGHYDRYFWVLATMSALNILYYLVCSWAYGPSVGRASKPKVSEEDNGSKEEALTEFGNGNGDKVDKGFKISEENGSKEQELTELGSVVRGERKKEGSFEGEIC